jgi:hypothetical protein
MFPARWAPHVSAGALRRFRRSPAAFPPEYGGVSAGYRGVPPEGGRRAAARSLRGRPDGPGAGADRRPLPGHAIHFADGRTTG